MTNKSKIIAVSAGILVLGGCAGETIRQVYDYEGWEWNTECRQNLSALHSGLLTYSQDYDDRFPEQDWAVVIQPYVKVQQKYTCPALYSPGTSNSGYSMNPLLYGESPYSLGDSDYFVTFFESTGSFKGHTDDPADHLTTSRHAGSIYQIYLSGYVENIGEQP